MDTQTNKPSVPPEATAVVVGLCTHGLATVRALSKHGVEVHALESDRTLPGVHTRHARVHFIPSINDEHLIDALIDIHGTVCGNSGQQPVLFLMNDNMVLEVAGNWERLQSYYRLSWRENREIIARLMIKSSLEAHCRETGLRYPQSWMLEVPENIDHLAETLVYPVVVKPVKPLGGFKVRVIQDSAGFRAVAQSCIKDFPLLVQQWIPGDDTRLLFCAFYFDEGREVSSLCGRKMRSHPPAHGQTTAAEVCVDEDLYHLSKQFFQGLGLSGPASLEMKRDDQGRLWVIEPTLGRTDFWLGLCVGNGVNIPYIEYCHVAGYPCELPPAGRSACWFDTERDPMVFAGFAWQRGFFRMWKNAVFSYLDAGDMKPFFVAFAKMLGEKGRNILNRFSFLPSRSQD